VLNKLLEEKGNPFSLAIVFSGIKKIKGIEFTEDSMNIFPANLDTTKPTDS
jgi:type I restriction enzyme, R subunit